MRPRTLLKRERDAAAAMRSTVRGRRTGLVRDIEVGRRHFRSGESEYLIDGRVCRLRDIQDLLMDSGVGVKAYAVVEQGKIGQILSARPMERRQLLEEAAGVTKYKSRRRAAELKIEAARQISPRRRHISRSTTSGTHSAPRSARRGGPACARILGAGRR